MIIVEQPPLEGVYIAHFGVKGMKWGQRKVDQISAKAKQVATPSSWNHDQKKVAAYSGAAATAVVLNQVGALKPLLTHTARFTYLGTAFVAEKLLNVGVTVIGTPIEMLNNL